VVSLVEGGHGAKASLAFLEYRLQLLKLSLQQVNKGIDLEPKMEEELKRVKAEITDSIAKFDEIEELVPWRCMLTPWLD
jgi:hypothetical protein